jgi:hypothetical protein
MVPTDRDPPTPPTSDRRSLLLTLPALAGVPALFGVRRAAGAPDGVPASRRQDDDRDREERRAAERAVREVERAVRRLERELARAADEVAETVDSLDEEDRREGDRALENIDAVEALLDPLADDVEEVFERGQVRDRDRLREDAIRTADEAIDLLEEVRDLVGVGDEAFAEQTRRSRLRLVDVEEAAAALDDAIDAARRTDLDRAERDAVADARRALRAVERAVREADDALADEDPEEAARALRVASRDLADAVSSLEDR